MSRIRISAIVRRILRQLRRDRRTIALVFVTPIVILSLIGYLLRGSASAVTFDVVDSDHSAVSQRLTNQLLGSQDASFKRATSQSASNAISSGSISGYLVFPPGFGTEIVTAGRIEPELHFEGSQPGPSATLTMALNHALANSAIHLQPKLFYVHGGPSLDSLDYFGAGYIGIAVFFLVFVVTSVAFLRERSQGTLERLMASPTRRGEIILGYMLGYAALATLQGLVIVGFTLLVLHVYNAGNVALIFLFVLATALGAVNLGIFLSMFAHTEFQAVQFIPIAVAPQLLLSGVLAPVSTEPQLLQVVSHVLPLTYTVDGLRHIMIDGSGLTASAVLLDLGVALLFVVLAAAAAALTMRRQVA